MSDTDKVTQAYLEQIDRAVNTASHHTRLAVDAGSFGNNVPMRDEHFACAVQSMLNAMVGAQIATLREMQAMRKMMEPDLALPDDSFMDPSL